jgi:hypothetical protein
VLKPLSKIAHYCMNGGVDGGRTDIGASKGYKTAFNNYLLGMPNEPYVAVVNGFMFYKMGKGESASSMPPSTSFFSFVARVGCYYFYYYYYFYFYFYFYFYYYYTVHTMLYTILTVLILTVPILTVPILCPYCAHTHCPILH